MNNQKYDREYLVRRVAEMRIKGKSTRFLLEFLQDKVGMGQTTAYEILKDAQKVFIELQSSKLEGALEEALSLLEELYEDTSDKKLRLDILKETNKLKGIYAAQRVEHTGSLNIAGIDIQIMGITNSNEVKD